ncbi:MAG: diacylglycerol kinase family lipid kinase [Ignavibacteriaceae bacterium]|nr:diacylglycerol kinase family lipid kinase [Ignavibacteriaceae bacterium]
MESKNFFIVNPLAGKGRGGKYIRQLQKVLQSLSIPLTNILLTEYPGHATELVKRIASDENSIFCVGGDGTVNEIINGIKHGYNLRLGVIPVGSGNDFARTIGNLSKDFSLEKYILSEVSNRCDIGHVAVFKNNELLFSKKFISSLGIGFDAFVSSKIKLIKILNGLLLYIFSVILSLFAYEAPKSSVKIEGTDVDFTDKVFLFTVGNTETAGGGFKLNPGAKIDDGYLNVCIARDISKFTLLKVLPKAITGDHIFDKRVYSYKFKTLKYSTDEKVFLHLDGEVFELMEGKKEIVISIVPNSQSIIING